MQLLDEAGYKDTDGDGLREDQKGKNLEIKLASMAGDRIAEEMTTFYMQNWKDVGLNVTLSTGRIIEFNRFYDKVQADDPEIDIFMAAWGTGTNPSPAGLYVKMQHLTSAGTHSEVRMIISCNRFTRSI